ncbi:MAG: ligand-binding sensor domain-containing diguanylate cyclase [Acidobacteriota bacterium]
MSHRECAGRVADGSLTPDVRDLPGGRLVAARDSAPECSLRRLCPRPAHGVAGLLLFAAAASVAHATRLPLRVYTPREGLPQSQVSVVLQDREGFLWVATRAGGIGRFDAHGWTAFDTSSGLPSAGVEALDMSPAGTIFAGTNGGPARRQGSSWIPLFPAGEGTQLPVTAILAVSDELVWIGTRAGLRAWRPGEEPGTPARTILSGSRVTCLARAGAGSVWVGTATGLFRLDPGQPWRAVPIAGLPPGDVRAVLDRPGRGLLVAVEGAGLFVGGPGSFSRVGDDARPGRVVRSLLAETDEPDAVWVGTDDRGAYRWAGDRWTRLSQQDGLPDASVAALYEDREGVLWIGTGNGLVKRGSAAFATFTSADGFPEGGRTYGMTESPDGDLWFAAYKDGVVRMRPDGTIRRYGPADGLPASPVNDIEADPAGGVWVATRLGLAHIDGDRVRRLKLPPGAPVAHRVLLAAPGGDLYIGTFHEGLVVVRGGGLRRVGRPVGSVVAALYRARDGTVWCGGEGWGAVGLRAGGEPIVLGAAERLPSGQVNGIFEDSRGTLWIATERGAWRKDASGEVSILDRSSGLPDSYVYWVAEGPDGAMWFGTNHGAARLDAQGRWDVFTSRDGLASDECNEDGVFIDSRGRLFIATEGVSMFLGSRQPTRSLPPPILLERVRIGDRTLERPAQLEVGPGQGPLAFVLAAPSFACESATRIRYRLTGLSESWSLSEPGQLEINFGGLGSGRYRFEALAVTGDGRVSDLPVTVAVRVPPRWYSSPAFIAIAVALGGLGVAMVVKVRERNLEARRVKLAAQVAARTEELRQANERLAELAIRDDLTGLPNRRAVLERLREAMSSARRHERDLAVAMIDVDGFKRINDVHGHEVGDVVLQRIGAAMRQGQRQEDTLGRYGGDEFLAVMPGCNESAAVHVAARLRQAVAAVEVPEANIGAGGSTLSISVGIAVFDATVADERELVRRADDLLYRAKTMRAHRSDNGDHLAG